MNLPEAWSLIAKAIQNPQEKAGGVCVAIEFAGVFKSSGV